MRMNTSKVKNVRWHPYDTPILLETGICNLEVCISYPLTISNCYLFDLGDVSLGCGVHLQNKSTWVWRGPPSQTHTCQLQPHQYHNIHNQLTTLFLQWRSPHRHAQIIGCFNKIEHLHTSHLSAPLIGCFP